MDIQFLKENFWNIGMFLSSWTPGGTDLQRLPSVRYDGVAMGSKYTHGFLSEWEQILLCGLPIFSAAFPPPGWGVRKNVWRWVWQGFWWFPEVRVAGRLEGAGSHVGSRRRTSIEHDRIPCRVSPIHCFQVTAGTSILRRISRLSCNLSYPKYYFNLSVVKINKDRTNSPLENLKRSECWPQKSEVWRGKVTWHLVCRIAGERGLAGAQDSRWDHPLGFVRGKGCAAKARLQPPGPSPGRQPSWTVPTPIHMSHLEHLHLTLWVLPEGSCRAVGSFLSPFVEQLEIAGFNALRANLQPRRDKSWWKNPPFLCLSTGTVLKCILHNFSVSPPELSPGWSW